MTVARFSLTVYYVDDTFIVMNGRERDADNLLDYVNSLHPNIKFTCKENKFTISFLAVKNIRESSKVQTTIFRKKMYTGVSRKRSIKLD